MKLVKPKTDRAVGAALMVAEVRFSVPTMGSVVNDDVGQPNKHNTSSEMRINRCFLIFRSFLCPTGFPPWTISA